MRDQSYFNVLNLNHHGKKKNNNLKRRFCNYVKSESERATSHTLHSPPLYLSWKCEVLKFQPLESGLSDSIPAPLLVTAELGQVS